MVTQADAVFEGREVQIVAQVEIVEFTDSTVFQCIQAVFCK